MKTISMLFAAALYVTGAAAFAHDAPGGYHPSHRIGDAHRAIHHTRHELHADKRTLAHDENVARIEAREARAVGRRQDELRAQGHFHAAHRLEKTRRHEADEAAIARRNVSHDRNVIAIKRAQIAHQRNVIAIERRNGDRGGY